MNELKAIKQFYKPVQPSVRAEGNEIEYREIQPTGEAQNYIHCFWQLRTNKRLEKSFDYRVVSDGCIDIFFNCENPEENFLMGFCRKFTVFPLGQNFNYIGIRFLPSVFPLLFNIDAKGLSNQFQKLQKVLPDLSDWIETNLIQKQSFGKIARSLNRKFEAIIVQDKLELDLRFFNSLHIILQHHGNVDTEKDLKTGLSPRQLRRIFNYYIGTTPKAFSNVVRFQYILNAKPSNQSLKGNKLYYDVGFFDQSHFIKNFKTFYGVTPSEAFQ